MADLEELKPQAEVAEPTLKEEVEEPTPLKDETTPSKTYTQKELDQAVGKGRSSTEKQLGLTKAEMQRLQSQHEALQEQLREAQREVEALAEKQFEEDPERLQAFRSKKQVDAKLKELAAKELAIQQREAAMEAFNWAVQMKAKADELTGKHDIPDFAVKLMDKCQTEDELEEVAAHFPMKSTVKVKVDSGVGSSGGKRIYTEEQIGDRNFYIANRDDILQAAKEGRIKVK